MKIVIDIPQIMYGAIKEYGITFLSRYDKKTLRKSIANGTPLPKHHGRLIDADRLTRAEVMHLWYHLPNGDIACPKIDIDHAPTIIEAEESESE